MPACGCSVGCFGRYSGIRGCGWTGLGLGKMILGKSRSTGGGEDSDLLIQFIRILLDLTSIGNHALFVSKLVKHSMYEFEHSSSQSFAKIQSLRTPLS